MSFKKNTAVTGFTFGLVSATDGSDVTTGTPVGYVTLDGGTQTAIGDVTPVHEGNGQWSFDLTAAEMNGDIVGLVFTHTSAITVHFTIKTETKLVSELNDVSTAQVNAECDTAITDAALATAAALADVPTVAEFNARTPTAAQLAYMVENANTGITVTFTTAGGSTTTAVLNLVDGSAGSATNDQYNGRLLVFTDGTLKGVVTDITDYVGSTTTATITAIPTAPTASHNARLI